MAGTGNASTFIFTLLLAEKLWPLAVESLQMEHGEDEIGLSKARKANGILCAHRRGPGLAAGTKTSSRDPLLSQAGVRGEGTGWVGTCPTGNFP